MVTEPIKRGPGRPRKVVPDAAPEPVEIEAAPPEVKTSEPKKSADPKIGQFVGEGAKGISYPDGSEYRCVDGVITERVH